MRLSRRRRTTSVRMNMTPMIDIVFLLIIFFMTVSQVSEVNREVLDLPKQKGSQEQKPTTLTVNIDQHGEIIIAGTVYPMSDLIAMIADELVRLGDDPNKLTVVLRCDQRGTSRTVNETVNALTRMQIKKVNIAVQVPD